MTGCLILSDDQYMAFWARKGFRYAVCFQKNNFSNFTNIWGRSKFEKIVAFFQLWNFFLKKTQKTPKKFIWHRLETSLTFQMVPCINVPNCAKYTIFVKIKQKLGKIKAQNQAGVKNSS